MSISVVIDATVLEYMLKVDSRLYVSCIHSSAIAASGAEMAIGEITWSEPRSL